MLSKSRLNTTPTPCCQRRPQIVVPVVVAVIGSEAESAVVRLSRYSMSKSPMNVLEFMALSR